MRIKRMDNFVLVKNLDLENFELDTATKKIKVKGAVKGLTLENATDGEPTKLVITKNDGTKEEVDLAPLVGLDKFVTSGVLENNNLKLTLANGEEVAVSLDELSTKTENTVTVELVGTGADNAKLQANVKVSTDADNALKVTDNGLKVKLKETTTLVDAFGDEFEITL